MRAKSSLKTFLSLPFQQKTAILFSQPVLLFLLPRTFWRLLKNVIFPDGNGENVTGFSPRTALVFPWYLRIADCVKKYGKRGYVYEDGLGFSLKERFWLNPLALKIYEKLRIRKFSLITSLIFLLDVLLIGYLEGIAFWQLGILALLITGSSVFLTSFFRLAKPENLSWAIFPIALYGFVKGYYLLSALSVFLISVFNFTVTLLTIESILLYGFLSTNFISGILVSIIPTFKILFDLLPFLKNSFFKGLAEVLGGGMGAKSRKNDFLRIRPNDLYLIFFYLFFVLSFKIGGAPLIYAVFLLNPLILFIVNQNIFRFSDNNTFFRFFLGVGTVFLLLHPSQYAFWGYIIFIYISSIGLIEGVENVLKDYPHLKPYSVKSAGDFLDKFFSTIPKRARIIFERQDHEKEMSGFATIFYYFEYLFSKRDIEFLPMEWMRLTQLDYFIKEYPKINAKSSWETVEEKIKELGGNYIMAYSDDFERKLKEWGYEKIGILKWDELKAAVWNSEEIIEHGYEGKDLHLFKIPFENSRISPLVALEIRPNRMEFYAKAGTEYTIKYNYHPSWQASQNGKNIKIHKAKGKLSYLTLIAENDGKVELNFNTSWFK